MFYYQSLRVSDDGRVAECYKKSEYTNARGRSETSDMFFFLMIRRPPRSTQGVSSAASNVYKRQQ